MGYEPKQAVQLPLTDFLMLELHLMDQHPGIKPDDFVAELVTRWLALETERLARSKNGPPLRGFQWKDIFLPEGTCMRTSYCGVIEFAKVVENRIVADDGRSLTPSAFANQHGRGRNAWRFVWLRFPGNEHWIRADNLRRRSGSLKQSKSDLEKV